MVKEDNKDALITFLIETKDGNYAKIDIDSIKYSRMVYQTYLDEINYIYYYG